MLDFQARHTTSRYQINNSRYHKHSFSKAISSSKITKTGKRLSIFLGKNNVCSRWGKMVDVWPSIIEDDRAREMRFKMRRWKKSTEKANIVQKEKDQVKTNKGYYMLPFQKRRKGQFNLYFPVFYRTKDNPLWNNRIRDEGLCPILRSQR